MNVEELLILLPCHSLEDFPTYHEGDDAQSLLASWSALWRPELVAAAAKAPEWKRVEDPPSDLRGRIIVVPTVCRDRLPTGFAQRVKQDGGLLIRGKTSREEIVEAALAFLGDNQPRVEAELAADFLALGYCYLQIELLTRQMRYSSNLDETYFRGQVVAAAQAAVAGDEPLAREKLGAAFSVLAEERDHYYPVDAFVLDLNLTAPTTLGQTLRDELAGDSPTNLLLSAALAQELAAKEPSTLEIIRSRLAAGTLGLIGGEVNEIRWPLLSLDTCRAELVRGREAYQAALGAQPEVFGRWRAGFTPLMPAVLQNLGFRGALHAVFEDGKMPQGGQLKVRWEGIDGGSIDAIARTPLDASSTQTFLQFAVKLGESMDADHVATLSLAHWPGQASPWLNDLRRIARYGSALGKFVTSTHYFRETAQPTQLDRFEADRYRSPYLKQAVIRKQAGGVSTCMEYWQALHRAAAVQSLNTLAVLVNGKPTNEPPAPTPAEITEEHAVAESSSNPWSARAAAAQALAGALTRGAKGPTGSLVLNPASYVRRIGVADSQIGVLPPVGKPVYAAAEHSAGNQVLVDVPAYGFVWLPRGPASPPDRKAIILAEANLLRNEFFEAIINPITGTLSAIHEYSSRGNRLSQQLALRMPGPRQKPGDTYRDPDETAVYSVMAADSVEVKTATTVLGEIVCRGRLLDRDGGKLAGFAQTYRIWRGRRVLEIDVELDPLEEPRADPWNSYYCARFAWGDDTAELFRTLHQTRQPATSKQFESPHYVDLVGAKHATTILTGGCPFHRRHEDRMLDTLLLVRGESARNFRLGIGIDLTHPQLEAQNLLDPPPVVHDVQQPTSGASGWLLHLDARNVIATSCEPLVAGGRVDGVRLRLLETAGRPSKLSVRCFRPFASAKIVNGQGETLHACEIAEGAAKLELAPYQWQELVAHFAAS